MRKKSVYKRVTSEEVINVIQNIAWPVRLCKRKEKSNMWKNRKKLRNADNKNVSYKLTKSRNRKKSIREKTAMREESRNV